MFLLLSENQEQQEIKLDKTKKGYQEGFKFLQEPFQVNFTITEEEKYKLLNLRT